MNTYDLYGSKLHSMDQLREAVEDVLDIKFEARQSTFMGGGYFLSGDLGAEHFLVQRNLVDDGNEAELIEPVFAEYPILLQVNATPRGDAVKEWLAAISGLDFLRRAIP